MTVLWTVIAVLWAALVVVSLVDVIRRKLGGGRTAAWVLLLLIFPFVGVLVYWVMRRPSGDEVARGLEADSDMRHGTPPPPGARLGS